MKRLIYNKIGLLTLLLLIPVFGFAQEKTIKGKITDETGYGVPGVSVVIQGTTNGTITNIEGEYVLNAIAGETLHVSFIGYKSQTVVVSASGSVYDFVLEEEFISLNEVVAIGYGKAQKKDLTSAISSVDGDALKTMSVGNPVSALQGKAAGIQVVSGSGAPGSAPKVLIRGFTSVTLGAEPLYVVDGVPWVLISIF